eukprot:6473955-Amphidinium_carterae.2
MSCIADVQCQAEAGNQVCMRFPPPYKWMSVAERTYRMRLVRELWLTTYFKFNYNFVHDLYNSLELDKLPI